MIQIYIFLHLSPHFSVRNPLDILRCVFQTLIKFACYFTYNITAHHYNCVYNIKVVFMIVIIIVTKQQKFTLVVILFMIQAIYKQDFNINVNLTRDYNNYLYEEQKKNIQHYLK